MNIRKRLVEINQEQLLKFENELDAEQKECLYNQIEEIDFSCLKEIGKKEEKVDKVILPIKALTVSAIEENRENFEKLGLNALKNQEVGALLLAGGMGTRLGSNTPKGMYNIGKTKEIFIFQRLFENILEIVKKTGKPIPLFIMTSSKNNNETIQFLEKHEFFGYNKNYIRFFEQEEAPCCDFNGRVFLEEKGKVATSPNGNGGWFNSLLNNPQAKEMLNKFNIKWLNVFAVDNVLQKIADPVFIGATISGKYEVGSKVIRKVDPFEKVGVMCLKNNRPSVIEYIDLTEQMAMETDIDGERVYNFGVILNYLFNVKTLYEIKDKKLPVHVVTKKVPYINEKGEIINPQEPNAYKFEMLCVDLIELSRSCLPFEVVREREFAPIKNKTGVDSVESAQRLLEENGFEL